MYTNKDSNNSKTASSNLLFSRNVIDESNAFSSFPSPPLKIAKLNLQSTPLAENVASSSSTPVRMSLLKSDAVSKGLLTVRTQIRSSVNTPKSKGCEGKIQSTPESIPKDGSVVTDAGKAIQFKFIFQLVCNGEVFQSLTIS